MKKYNQIIKNDSQNLLECKHFSKQLNKIEKKSYKTSKSDPKKHPLLVPELCEIIPISSSLFTLLSLMPSVLHRVNSFILERELFSNVGLPTNRSERFWSQPLSFTWSNPIVQNQENVVLSFVYKSTLEIHPGMILQALTPC